MKLWNKPIFGGQAVALGQAVTEGQKCGWSCVKRRCDQKKCKARIADSRKWYICD